MTLPNIWAKCPSAKLGRENHSLDYQCPRRREKLDDKVSFPLFGGHWRKSKNKLLFPIYLQILLTSKCLKCKCFNTFDNEYCSQI